MKAMLCGCGRRLEATNDDRLVREALAHRRREHATPVADEEDIRRVVEENNAYGLEHAAPYADGNGRVVRARALRLRLQPELGHHRQVVGGRSRHGGLRDHPAPA